MDPPMHYRPRVQYHHKSSLAVAARHWQAAARSTLPSMIEEKQGRKRLMGFLSYI